MVKTEINEVRQLGNMTTLNKMDYGYLVVVMIVQLDEVLSELEWGTLGSCLLFKEMTVSGITNSHDGGNFLQESALKT